MRVFRVDDRRAIVIDLITHVEIIPPHATYEWAFGWSIEAHFVGDGKRQVFQRPHRHRIGGSQYNSVPPANSEEERANLEAQDEMDARVLFSALLAEIERPCA